MIIKEITLYSHDLLAQRRFYREACGFEIVGENESSFSVKVGNSTLTFERTASKLKYHYCFLIAENQLDSALQWCLKRGIVPISETENLIVTQGPSWNAKSIYFYDGNGNIAEFIVRYDLSIVRDGPFDSSQIVSFNEIGVPIADITSVAAKLKRLGVEKWRGTVDRFLCAGDQSGLFLLINNQIKKTWFPTQLATDPAPWRGVFEANEKDHHIVFDGDGLYIS